MINASHTLQTHPILKPHDPLPRIFKANTSLLLQAPHKLLLNKLLNDPSRLRCDIALLIVYGNWRPRPDKDVFDTWLEAVGPIV